MSSSSREADDVHFELIAHPGLLEGLAHVAVEEPDGREVLDAGEAERAKLLEEEPGDDERVGPVDAREDRRVLHDGQDLERHLLDDLVGVAVGEKARGAAAAGHAVAAGVVDDQQVDAARFLALRGEAGARAAPDDRLAAGDLLAESLENALPGIVDAHEVPPIQFSPCRTAKSRCHSADTMGTMRTPSSCRSCLGPRAEPLP